MVWAASYFFGYGGVALFGELLFRTPFGSLSPLQAAQAGLTGDLTLLAAVPTITRALLSRQTSLPTAITSADPTNTTDVDPASTAGPGRDAGFKTQPNAAERPQGGTSTPFFAYELSPFALSAAVGTAVAAVGLNVGISQLVLRLGGDGAANTERVQQLIQQTAAAAPADGDVAQVQVLLALGAVVIAPVYEEYFYRGFLLPAFTKSWGRQAAVAASALAFSAVHLSGADFVQLWVLGTVLGYSYVTVGRDNLLVPTLAHSLYNAAIFVAISSHQ